MLTSRSRLYAATKKADELMSHVYSHLYGLSAVGLRFFTVYGPWGRPDMAMWLFTEAILAGKPDQGLQPRRYEARFHLYRRYRHGSDRHCRQTPRRTRRKRAVIAYNNIGNNRPEDLMHMISVLENALGREAEKTMLPMQPGDGRGDLCRH